MLVSFSHEEPLGKSISETEQLVRTSASPPVRQNLEGKASLLSSGPADKRTSGQADLLVQICLLPHLAERRGIHRLRLFCKCR